MSGVKVGEIITVTYTNDAGEELLVERWPAQSVSTWRGSQLVRLQGGQEFELTLTRSDVDRYAPGGREETQ